MNMYIQDQECGKILRIDGVMCQKGFEGEEIEIPDLWNSLKTDMDGKFKYFNSQQFFFEGKLNFSSSISKV